MSTPFIGIYSLVNCATDTVADLSRREGQPTSHYVFPRAVVGYKENGEPRQQWSIELAPDGQFWIHNQLGLYLTIEGSVKNGTRLFCSNVKQSWEVRAVPQPRGEDSKGIECRIFYPGTDFVVDLEGSSSKNDTPIILYKKQNSGDNQKWRLEPIPATYELGTTYVLLNANSGTAADYSLIHARVGVLSIIGYRLNGIFNQQWVLEEAKDSKGSSKDSEQFYVRNGTGSYLNIEGDEEEGAQVIGSTHKRAWVLKTDPKLKSAIRICCPRSSLVVALSDRGNIANNTKVKLEKESEGRHCSWYCAVA